MASFQKRLGDDCPEITWNGEDYPLVPGSAALRKDLGSGGFKMNADLAADVLVSSFPFLDAPTLKNAMLQTALVYLGDVYKVEAVTIYPGGLQVRLEANALAQNA